MSAVMKATTRINQDGSERVFLGRVIWKEKPARKRAKRQEWGFSLALLRMREIEAVIRHRHGSIIPNPHGTDDVEFCHAYLRAVALTPGGQDVESWSRKWAPWVEAVTLENLGCLSRGRKRIIRSDAVANLLLVTMDERTILGLKTIGAFDISKDEREKLSRQRKRERDRDKKSEARRSIGRKDRKSYEAQSFSQMKPWEAKGISRRTWERRRDASMARIDITTNDDTLASNNIALSISTIPLQKTNSAAGRLGLGDNPPAELQEAAPHGNGDTVYRRVI